VGHTDLEGFHGSVGEKAIICYEFSFPEHKSVLSLTTAFYENSYLLGYDAVWSDRNLVKLKTETAGCYETSVQL
jgi:hypothetical protein